MSYLPDAGGPSPWAAAPIAPGPPRGSGGKTIALVLLLVAGGMTVVCCGLGGLAYYGMQQALQPAQHRPLPQRSRSGAADVSDLVQALQRPAAAPHSQEATILRWLASQVARAERGGSIAPEADLFYAAVLNSPDGDQLNLLQQAQLHNSLRLGLPEPSVAQHYAVLDITADSAPNTARVAIVFYGVDSLPSLHHWFLIQTAGQWQLYDWFDADSGRRRSDEYANYFRHLLDDRAEGYDRVIELVNQAYQVAGDEDPEQARRLLRDAELVTCLPADRDRALLEIGRAYQTLVDHAAAVRVFERAVHPHDVPGIWSSLAVSQLDLDDPEAALRSADQLRTIYEHHPAAEYITANAYSQLNQPDKAADHFLRYLAQCPDDGTSYQWLTLTAKPAHAADLVRIAQSSKTSEEYLLQLFDFHVGDGEMLSAVDAALAESDASPAVWQSLSNILLKHASGDLPGALQQLAALGTHGGMSERFTERREDWLVEWSIEQGDVSPLRQHQAFERLMQRGAEAIVWEEMYFQPAQVEAAMAALGDADQRLAAVAAMRVWAAWQEDRYEDVVIHGFTYLDASPDLQGEQAVPSDEEHAGQALRDEVVWRVNDSLARLGRVEEALARFGDDPQRCWEVLETLFQRRDVDAMETVRQQFADSQLPTAAMAMAAIDATLAEWQGSAETADRHWVACLKAFEPADHQGQAFSAAAQRRGATAARLRNVLPPIGDASVPGWSSTVQAICKETLTLMDVPLLRDVQNGLPEARQQPAAAEDQDSLPETLWQVAAEMFERQNQWASAVANRRRLLEAADPDGWTIGLRRQQLLTALLRSGVRDVDEQIQELLEPAQDDAIWASYHVALGSSAVACSHLSKLDSEQRGEWFTSLANRPYVLHNREWIDCLPPSNRPLNISYVEPAGSILLIEHPYRNVTDDQMRAAVRRIVPNALVTEVTSGIDAADRTRWVIRNQDGVDIVVTLGRGTFTAGQLLPAAAAKALSDSRGYIGIDVIRSSYIPAHLLAINLAAGLATASTQMVYDDRSQYAWYGDTSRWFDRLQWDDRLPIDDQSASIGYLFFDEAEDALPPVGVPSGTGAATETSEPPAPTSGQAVPWEWLQKRLADQGQSHPVMLKLSSRYSSERLAAVAIAVDSDNLQVEVELREGSALLPTLQRGDRLLADPYQLTQP